MSYTPEAPLARDWDDMRSNEAKIYEQCHTFTPMLYPGYEAVDVWQSGMGIEFDTTAYFRLSSLFSNRPQTASLILYNQSGGSSADDSRRSLVKIFELSLRPGKEKLVAYAALLQVAWQGLCVANAPDQRRYRSLYKTTGFDTPTNAEYEVAREQFARGANGVFRILHPNQTDPTN